MGSDPDITRAIKPEKALILLTATEEAAESRGARTAHVKMSQATLARAALIKDGR
jgi:hypothetical protein